MKKTIHTDAPTLASLAPYSEYLGYYFTADGRAFRQTGGELVQIKGTRIGKRGHVIMTIAGQTIYLARMIYCLFNDIEYDKFCGRIRYIDSDYSNCWLSNLTVAADRSEPERKGHVKYDPWKIREMYVSGLSPVQITQLTGVREQKVKDICAGFESVGVEEMAQIKRIIGTRQGEK